LVVRGIHLPPLIGFDSLKRMATFTPEESKNLFTRIMDRMVAIGWLHSYTFTDGKGYHLNWTEVGTERAMCLKKIALTFDLKNDDRAPVAFDIIAQGDSLRGFVRPFELDPDIAAYWCQSVNQLGYRGSDDDLLGLVHIVTGWAPDAGTRVKFIS
jgi:hypothetical protein